MGFDLECGFAWIYSSGRGSLCLAKLFSEKEKKAKVPVILMVSLCEFSCSVEDWN